MWLFFLLGIPWDFIWISGWIFFLFLHKKEKKKRERDWSFHRNDIEFLEHFRSSWHLIVVQLLNLFWLCKPVDWGMSSSPVIYCPLEFAPTYVHWVSDAIQTSHPQPPPAPPVLNLSQYQGLFQWLGSSHQLAKVLEVQLQHQSFQWIFRTYFL